MCRIIAYGLCKMYNERTKREGGEKMADERQTYINENPTDRQLFGRRQIFTTLRGDEITDENVVDIVNNALVLHIQNYMDEEYLYWYRRGVQPILGRKKTYRPEICNKVVTNTADQICTFKNGFFLQKPVAYISRRADEDVTDRVRQYNEYLFLGGNNIANNEVVNWFDTVGIGVKYVEADYSDERRPLRVWSLDPRTAFVVYSSRPGREPVLGVNIVIENGEAIYDVFTKDRIFHLSGGFVTGFRGTYLVDVVTTAIGIARPSEPNIIGYVPMVEYFYNENRMGCFENAISLLDAYNTAESNRLDGIEQNIQQLCVAYNCQFEEGTTANQIREAGMIVLKSTADNKADFKILSEGLDQNATQTTLKNLYEHILMKCAMPTTSKGGTSTSDTGTAVYLRDGYQIADVAARNTTDLFEKSEEYFNRVCLAILRIKDGFELSQADFTMRMERNSAENMLAKTQVAMNLKSLGFAPALAFERSGISSDALNDVEVSEEYIERAWSAEPQEAGQRESVPVEPE